METGRATSAKRTIKILNKLSNAFVGIGCFKGTFSLKVKEDTKLYQVPTIHVAHTQQEPFRKKLERLQEQQMLAPLLVDKMATFACQLDRYRFTRLTFGIATAVKRSRGKSMKYSKACQTYLAWLMTFSL